MGRDQQTPTAHVNCKIAGRLTGGNPARGGHGDTYLDKSILKLFRAAAPKLPGKLDALPSEGSRLRRNPRRRKRWANRIDLIAAIDDRRGMQVALRSVPNSSKNSCRMTKYGTEGFLDTLDLHQSAARQTEQAA